jgi:hypothetical protein
MGAAEMPFSEMIVKAGALDLYLSEIDCGLEAGAITPETANALKADLLTVEQYLEGYAPDEFPMQAANQILAQVSAQLTDLFNGGC